MAKKQKRIPDDTYRVIKISKEAIYEFIYENMIDDIENLVDVSDATTVVEHFRMDWQNGEFIMIARNELRQNEHLQFPDQLDSHKLMSNMKDTTSSMFSGEKRYIDLSIKDIEDTQNNT